MDRYCGAVIDRHHVHHSSSIAQDRSIAEYANSWCVHRFFLAITWIPDPEQWPYKLLLFLISLVITALGTAIYLSPRVGSGPRDWLMVAITDRSGWKLSRVKTTLEISVLLVGWLLGGPVFIGTVIYTLAIGPLLGFFLTKSKLVLHYVGGGIPDENINKRPVRTDNHDGVSQ